MSDDNRQIKIYRLIGIDSAMELLRPKAKWEITNNKITKWDDPRPCPTWEELQDVMKKAQDFEDSINTIWRDDQIEEMTGHKKES